MTNPNRSGRRGICFPALFSAAALALFPATALSAGCHHPTCRHWADCTGEPRLPEYLDVKRSAAAPAGKAAVDITVQRHDLPGNSELTILEPAGAAFASGKARVSLGASASKAAHQEQLLLDAGRALPHQVVVRLTVQGSKGETAMVIDKKVELGAAPKSSAPARVPVLMTSANGRTTVQQLPADQAAQLVARGVASYGKTSPQPGKPVNASPEADPEVAQ